MGAAERNQKMIDIKKNDIINGMERALLLKNYNSLTIDDVAKEAEYSKKTIYSYFTSKDEIYLELILQKFNLLNEALEKAVNSSGKTGIEKITVLGKAYYGFANDHPEYIQAIINYEANRKYEYITADKILDQYNKDLDKSFLLLVNAIREGIAEGAISDKTDIVSAAILLWSAINGFIMLALKKGEYLKNSYGKTAESLFDYNMEMLLHLLRGC